MKLNVPPNWKAIRKQILERDNYTCQSCKTRPKSPHVHHIIPRRNGGNDTSDNLITKCLSCHIIEEAKEKSDIQMRMQSVKDIQLYRLLPYRRQYPLQIECPKCHKMNSIKSGKSNKKQRWFCKNCFSYFVL
jgi:ssDNA-binding Zn-finger/Zn-ribbon topoisomerase 1